MTNQRPMRADAIRNRAKILEAARTEIAEHGPDVGMEVIAGTAGVAVGTLYRHFPTKTDLVGAVLAEYVERITVEAESARDHAREGRGSPLTVLVSFLREVIRISALNAAAKSAAPALGAAADIDETRAAAALSELIDMGIAAGQVRRDLSVTDIYMLISAAPLDQPEPVRERWAALVLPCLTVDAARSFP
ncbi:TetR/AcrR family transcriptional regulator [Paenarthrobacter sp. JL.01a]|uniref:TetR/AcrR family transcriptional regulator n=1 Tax=Paenarthrobacter sp. JL.01a TaxID=2979324 RepID=UPI0021C6C170|nr:TetR/AcrR family transcriptional regulator [Paenarthrobacter sp. JL.01a]UXM92188.1 TetR/AcrR family transcriptional regulator [Paenarthrobacter sp. JL.01a]